MKILIDNGGYILRNVGDSAMLQVTVSRFEKLYPQAEIHVFTIAPEVLKELCPNAIPVPAEITLNGRWFWIMPWNTFGGLHKLLPIKAIADFLRVLEIKLRLLFPHSVQTWLSWRLKQKGVPVRQMLATLNLIRSCDVVVATGGGYITDAFDTQARGVLEALNLARFFGKPTALFGQGLGPIKSQALDATARFCLPKIDLIALREGIEGVSLLKAYNVSDAKISITGDDAIELAYSNRPANLGQDIGINIRISSYSTLNENIIEGLGPVLERAKTKFNAKLRAIPVSSNENESDLVSITRLFANILDADGKDLNKPVDVIKEVGKCKVVITGSYHGAVFALSQGVNAVCLVTSTYYRHKFEGLVAQFNCGCYIVDINDAEFANNIDNALNEAWQTAESNNERLKLEAQKQITNGVDAYERFAKIINNHQAIKNQ